MSEVPNEPPPIEGELVDDDAVAAPAPVDYTSAGVPTFDYVRDRIENRYATSGGATELAGGSPEAESLEEQFTARERAARDRLEEIRRSMGRG